ncbi:MAG: cyclic nucleotide-binding domain-containing protein [Rhodanobacteraceae bacterium]|nr:cyclic nucleotide-binding domain-containing protein [Rhodanobacteraceae bacterium]
MSIDASQLKHLYPLDSLRPDHLDVIAREAESAEYAHQQALFRAGDQDEVTHYLLAGIISGAYPDGKRKDISADSLQGRYPIGDLMPRRFTATVESLTATIVSLDRRFLEKVITFDQLTRTSGFKLLDKNPEGNRWIFRLLQNNAMRRVPAGNLERLFARFEEISVKADQTIVREGDDGDYFYVIKDGAASVLQSGDGDPAVVAYLVRGDSFGEDALLSNSVRNASVTMMKDGKLMRLRKSDFSELLKQPTVEWLTPGKASILVRQGAGIVDVRLPEEFDERAIKGSINMPLYRLREYTPDLDKDRSYVCYCNTGERSAAAAYILTKLGFEAFALAGGMSGMVKQMDKKA